MYVRVRQVRRLGSFNLDSVLKVVDTGAKAVATVKGSGGGGGSASAPAQKSAAPTAAGSNFLESLSNTELAIGGVSVLSLALALTR